MVRRIALVTHSLASGGGTGTMTAFLYRVLAESGKYQPDVISLASSATDFVSVRLLAPGTWLRGPGVESGAWCSLPYRHIGAVLVEFEFQRYRPHAALIQLLRQYDLIQFIVGTPPWACVGDGAGPPLLLWTATTVRPDRATRVRQSAPLLRAWRLLMTRLTEAYERHALEQAQFVFALSEYTLSSVRRWVSPERAALAVCGVDTALFRPHDQREGDYILSVARFSDPRKNLPLLLHAYAQLAARRSSVPDLVLVGEAPSQAAEGWARRLGILHRVRFRGLKEPPELAELYRNAMFFVLPSDEEGLGIVVLEAMASGLPVVSTRCGGPAMAVIDGETGFLTPVGDVSSLAERMERILRDPALRRRFGKVGRQMAEEQFSVQAAGRVFLEKYDELLKGTR